MTNAADKTNVNCRTRSFARDHFEALRKAGLSTWTFDEFLTFCAPLAQRAALTSGTIEDAGCTTARQFADAVDELLQARHGRPLSPAGYNRVICTMNHALVAGRRRCLRLRRHTDR